MGWRWKRTLLYMSLIGPGIITASIDNDASGITTYSVAGARFGYELLWILLPVTIVLIMVSEMVARMGVVTGKGLSDLIREHFGVRVAFFLMAGLFVANFGTTVAEFAGWAASWEIFGVSKYVVVPLGAFFIWLLVIKGTYRVVETVLLAACLIYLGYVVSGFMAKPDWAEVAHSTFAPELKWDPEYVMLGIAIVGTTVTPWMQFYLQSSIVEKGVRKKHYTASKIDVVVGCILTNVIAYFIIVTSATTLFPEGIRINEASEAAMALRPFAGTYAPVIFALSLANASLLGAIIVPLATAYFICEAMGWERGVNKTFRQAPQFMWIYTAMIVFGSMIILVPGAPLISIMVLSSVINALLLPVVLIYTLYLANDRRIMGDYVNSRSYNYVTWAAIAVLIVFSTIMLLQTVVPGDLL